MFIGLADLVERGLDVGRKGVVERNRLFPVEPDVAGVGFAGDRPCAVEGGVLDQPGGRALLARAVAFLHLFPAVLARGVDFGGVAGIECLFGHAVLAHEPGLGIVVAFVLRVDVSGLVEIAGVGEGRAHGGIVRVLVGEPGGCVVHLRTAVAAGTGSPEEGCGGARVGV